MLHFLNCIALAFGPHVYFYRTYLKAQRSGFQFCATTFMAYVGVAIVKLFLIASLFHHTTTASASTSASSATPQKFSYVDELFACILRFFDLFVFIFLYVYVLPL